LIFLGVVSAAVLAGWLVGRVVGGPDAGKARAEVQRYYDARWPGDFKVEKCDYVEDAEGSSVFDLYDCRISAKCPTVLFSVPRAATFGEFDADPVPPKRARPRC
jgi:hypothetical protein